MPDIQVLICDDSALMRRSLTKMIESARGMKVIGAARDGEDAVIKARELMPDVVTMDINMPKLDGITALQIIVDEGIAPVLMVSSLTQEGAEASFQAMALGAFDYVAKPGGTVSINIAEVRNELIAKIKAAHRGRRGLVKRLSRKTPERKNKPSLLTRVKSRRTGNQFGFKAVAMGVSTGGPKTLFDVLPHLPKDLNAAVFLVQHMPPKFITSFAERVNNACEMTCVETSPSMTVEPGHIYMGAGGRHLTLWEKSKKNIILRAPSKPEHSFIPSVDVMMASVVKIFGKDTVGVLLTGMGDDGADGMVQIRAAGGMTIAESEETAIVFGMPQEAIKRGGADIVKPCYEIAEEIIKAVG